MKIDFHLFFFRQLKQMLEHGLILQKVHKVLSFSQSKWLKPYIEHNTNLRKQSKNKFEKDLGKYNFKKNILILIYFM